MEILTWLGLGIMVWFLIPFTLACISYSAEVLRQAWLFVTSRVLSLLAYLLSLLKRLGLLTWQVVVGVALALKPLLPALLFLILFLGSLTNNN